MKSLKFLLIMLLLTGSVSLLAKSICTDICQKTYQQCHKSCSEKYSWLQRWYGSGRKCVNDCNIHNKICSESCKASAHEECVKQCKTCVNECKIKAEK